MPLKRPTSRGITFAHAPKNLFGAFDVILIFLAHFCGFSTGRSIPFFSIKGLKATSAILCLVLGPQGVPQCKNLKFPSFLSRDTSVLDHLQGSYGVALVLNVELAIENAFSVAKTI